MKKARGIKATCFWDFDRDRIQNWLPSRSMVICI